MNPHIKCLKTKYGKIVERYEREGKREDGFWKDDRGIVVNLYNILSRGFQELEEVETAAIKVAFNEHAKKKQEEMDDIIRRFDDND